MFQNKELQNMDKRTGKIAILFVIIFNVLSIQAHNKNISVSIQNMQQQEIEHAQIGIPFLLQITVDNLEAIVEPKGLEIAKQCTVQFYGTTQSMSAINGVRTHRVLFTYVVTPDVKGSLELGPVTLTDTNGDEIRSEKIIVPVGDIAEPEYRQKQMYLLVADSNVKTAYLGQKIIVYLRFCYTKSFDNLSIENVAINGAHCGYQDPVWQQSNTTVGEHDYSCKQIYFELYPNKLGTLVIPQFKATFMPDQAQQQQAFGAGFFSLLGLANTRVVQSYPKGIEIVPLPESSSHTNVTAIGQFHKVTLLSAQKKGMVGEGMVLKMMVEGDGNLEIVRAPELQLPSGLHSYEGNSSLQRDGLQRSVKTFEWIVQADQPGSFVIPAQKFIYFDPVIGKYQQLMSASVTIKIDGTAISSQDHQPQETEKDVAPEQVEQIVQNPQSQDISHLESSTFFPPDKDESRFSDLLNWLICLLIILLVVLGAGWLLKPYMVQLFWVQKLQYQWKFWQICRQHNMQTLYHFFEQLGVDYGFGLQDEQLHDLFQKLNLSDETFENWQNFIVMLLEFNFAKYKSEEDAQLAFHLAKQWFPIILSCCKLQYKKSRIRSQE